MNAEKFPPLAASIDDLDVRCECGKPMVRLSAAMRCSFCGNVAVAWEVFDFAASAGAFVGCRVTVGLHSEARLMAAEARSGDAEE